MSPTSALGATLLLVNVAASSALAAGAVQSRPPTEPEVKAAYLFNFGRFVRWPAGTLDQDDAFAICVLGKDPFGRALDTTVSGETIDGHRILTRRLQAIDERAGCHILYIGLTDAARLTSVLNALAGAPVLTISDMPRFTERGGMIQFVSVTGRVRFEINVAAAEKEGLVPTADLLRVATSVRRGGTSP
jgi:hypothetical protein